MDKTPAALAALLTAWNEHDTTKIGTHLARAIADDVVFVDPNYTIKGRAAFEKMIADFRNKYPRSRSLRTSAVDAHHDRARYCWRVYVDEKNFVDGMDSVEFDANGLVRRCDGFFGVLRRTTPAYDD